MHFTYCEAEVDKTSLKQGDLLARTPALVEVLAEFHKYFAKEQYTHFIVLTQTCDLVKRPEPKSPYITLAAVRPLSVLINKWVTELPTTVELQEEMYCSDANRNKLIDPINKLFNNNLSGHFFLKSEPSRGLKHDSCAFLQLSIPIKTVLHYDTCLAAKTLELTEAFRAKLGWLVGDLFSRVGTTDYAPGVSIDKSGFDKIVTSTLESHVKLVPAKRFLKFKSYANSSGSFEDAAEKVEREIEASRKQRLNNLIKLVESKVTLTIDERRELEATLSAYRALEPFLNS
jgi:hypothetical protein